MDRILVWFRRDLRARDHAALHWALREAREVHCGFVFDIEILDALAERADRRVAFIREALVELDRSLDALARRAGRAAGSGLIVRHGPARERIPALAVSLGVDAVFANRDYEPEAIRRDEAVADRLRAAGIAFRDFKDQVLFDKAEVMTRSGRPFAVFTPYRRAWQAALGESGCTPLAVEPHAGALAARPDGERIPALAEIGFEAAPIELPGGERGARVLFDDFLQRIDRYHEARDYPALKGVSYLSVHLRFGTIAVRELAREALARGGPGAAAWLGELAWRDFYHQLLWHCPQVVERAFRPEFERVEWAEDPAGFAAWCAGCTGYPLVDAAMRQLNRSGYMHNRLRMVSASFLTKDLGIDWRLGERYFARRLNDYDLAANNGGWQWAASTGCDAQPWFRIFNPVTQSKRFDPDGRFIRRYVEELAQVPERFIHEPWRMSIAEQRASGCLIGRDYPAPCVDHAEARERTLARFEKARSGR